MGRAWWEVAGDVIRDYMDRYSSIAVVRLDNKETIQDCNGGFLQILNLSKKPVGRSIVDFLEGDAGPEKLATARKGEYFLLRFRPEDQTERTLNCIFVRSDEGGLLFGEKRSLTESQIVSEISSLNGQLTNMVREVEKKKRALEKANAEIQKLMRTDPLTGVANRRLLMETLDKEMSMARRHEAAFSVIMADLDFFKKINDTYGHDKGDEVLKGFARLLEEKSRAEDLVARFGGEEFIILLPRTTAEQAGGFADRIRKALRDLDFPGLEEPVTASFGVSQFEAADTAGSLLKRADQALYRCKSAGRDRVSVL